MQKTFLFYIESGMKSILLFKEAHMSFYEKMLFLLIFEKMFLILPRNHISLQHFPKICQIHQFLFLFQL